MCWMMADALFLHQSSLFRVMANALLLHQSLVCGVMTDALLHQPTLWRVLTDALLLHQLILLWGNGRCTITASVIGVCEVRPGALCLHQSSVCAERWLVKYYLINHHCVPSDDWYTICASVIRGGDDWRTVTACYQCVRSDDLSYCISYRCVRSDKWRSVTASDIAVCGVMTGKLLHQLPLCVEWWVNEYYCIRYRCVRSDDW